MAANYCLEGEEFVVLLPLKRREEAPQVAERLRQSISKQPIQLADHLVPVTIGVGGTPYQSCEDLCVDTIPRADRALYRDKQEGRDPLPMGS